MLSKGIAGVPGHQLLLLVQPYPLDFGRRDCTIILGVDRIMDMARTFCNIFGNCTATVDLALGEKRIYG